MFRFKVTLDTYCEFYKLLKFCFLWDVNLCVLVNLVKVTKRFQPDVSCVCYHVCFPKSYIKYMI